MKTFTTWDVEHGWKAILIAAATLFLILAVSLAFTRRPWCDEAWFANISHSLITRGNTGVSVVHPAGTANAPGGVMKDIDKGFYLWIPAQEFCNSLILRVIGFGVYQVRAISIGWGAVLLGALFFVTLRLSGSALAAALAVALAGSDQGFLMAATDGRKDAMSAALWLLGLAVYLWLRSRSMPRAILASQALVAFAMLAHPIGLVGGVVVGVAILVLDGRQLRVRHVAIAGVPYLIAAGIAAAYFLSGGEAFQSQFGIIKTSNRASGLRDPIQTVLREFTERIPSFYLPATSSGLQRWLRLGIPLLLGFGFLAAITNREIRRDPGKRLLGSIAAVSFLTMAIYDGAKHYYYLVHITPLLCAAAAMWLAQGWRDQPRWRLPLTGFFALLMALQVVWAVASITRDPYHRSFTPMTRFVQERLKACGEKCLVVGSAELGFALGFTDTLKDDALLGYRSGLKPNLIVMEPRAYYAHLEAMEKRFPEISSHMRRVLSKDFRKVYDDGYYQVFEKR